MELGLKDKDQVQVGGWVPAAEVKDKVAVVARGVVVVRAAAVVKAAAVAKAADNQLGDPSSGPFIIYLNGGKQKCQEVMEQAQMVWAQ